MSTITMTHLQTGDMEFDQDSEVESQVIVQNMYEIEEEFSQLKNLKYKQKLEQIENDIGLLEAGTLDVYVQKVAQLQKDKEATDKVAEISRDYRLQSIAHMVAFEKRTCENEYKLTRKKLYKARVNKLESRKRKLEAEHTQNAAIEAEIIAHNRRVGKQKLEKKNKGPNHKRRRLAIVQWPYVVYELTEAEITEDILAIKRALKASTGSKKKQTKDRVAGVDVSVERGELTYSGTTYPKGAVVRVTIKDVSYNAVLTDINQTEIHVNRTETNGKRAKINITQLRQGKTRLEMVA